MKLGILELAVTLYPVAGPGMEKRTNAMSGMTDLEWLSKQIIPPLEAGGNMTGLWGNTE